MELIAVHDQLVRSLTLTESQGSETGNQFLKAEQSHVSKNAEPRFCCVAETEAAYHSSFLLVVYRGYRLKDRICLRVREMPVNTVRRTFLKQTFPAMLT